MRILSISGQNIASLADTFLIDLDAEPLRSAGLFAITGETGAGKSSILDALCLALYGDAPRLSSGSAQDEVPDAAGEPIKARDPRAILRRGAAQGWAKVRFVAIDGLSYEASWSARRARDKVDGRLQGVSRQIARLSDGQVLASQLTAVTEQVQSLTGLSYDEFRRTVLLAQGDFDAFLRADTNDRAALLEKVTGTGLYRAISARVFDRTAEAQAAQTALTLQRDAHRLLSPEAIAALEADRQIHLTAIDSTRTERLALEADLARHARRAEAQARLSEAAAALTQAQTIRDAAAFDRSRLATLDSAEPLRLPFETTRQAEAAQIKAAAALGATETALAAAAAKAQTEQLRTAEATLAHDAKETEFKTLGPIWSEATRLDAQIKTAAAEADTAASATRTALAVAQGAQTRANQLRAQAQSSQSALTEATAALTALAPLAQMAERWPQIARDLADHDSASQTRRKALDHAASLNRALQDSARTLTQLDRAEAQDRTARAELLAQLATLTSQITALEARHPQDRLTHLTDLASRLATLDRTARDHATALAQHAAATQHLAQDTAAQHAAQATSAQAQDALTKAEAATLALTAPAEQANLAASENARQLRLRLTPGEPCPVCGATEHPTLADAALSHLAATLRADLLAARTAAQTAAATLTAAKGQAAGAEARATQARQMQNAAAERAATALTTWAQDLQIARANPLCPALPEAPQDLAPLSQARDLTETALTAARSALDTMASLRAEKDATDGRISALTTAIDTRAPDRQSLTQTQARLAQDAALSRQTAETADQRIAALAAELAPHLTAAAEPVAALTSAPTALRARLQAKVAAHAAALAAQATLLQTLTDLRPQLATAHAQAADTAQLATQAQQAQATRDAALQTLTESRAPLLGGEPTETHRSRFNQSRLAAQTTKAEADAALSLALSAESLALGARDSAARALSQAATAVEEAHDRLLHALSATELAPEALPSLFALPRVEVEALRDRLRALEDAVTAATSTHAARKADLTAAEAAGLPDRPAQDLTQALQTLDAAQSRRQEAIGAITAQLASDAATRTSLTDLQAQIDAATATLDIWAAVNAAIGSKSGDAFARIAQSITLDQLVDHANHHLADLKPRYRLRRAANLALQVEDLDMGAEARATRSLSGGERFLVSLALALALSRMGDKGGLAATLFIDEGFGSLDAESLDVAIDALDTLQSQGRMIGVISHVEAMKDRIPVQVRVRRQGGGKSVIHIEGPGSA